jgi:Ca2+-binding RTX toxin-like protein
MTASVISIALSASNLVPGSAAGLSTHPIGVNDLKPASCDGILLASRVEGSGVVSGGADSELVLGGTGADTIVGNGGDDCIVAGGGDDAIDGGSGNDVCIGGPGTDTFTGCESVIQEG